MLSFPNAKINIGLHIPEKRKDGFHNLESIFIPIALTDVLEVLDTTTNTEVVNLGMAISVVKQEENICYKAWKLLNEEYKIPPVKICVLKNIPMGAGLGGGSSDGAFTLRLLNEKFKLNLKNEKLKELGLKLGSDCPFFIDNKPKYVEGRGEILSDIDVEFSKYYICLVYPKLFISTPEAYSLIKPFKREKSLKEIILNSDINNWKTNVCNDFEAPLFIKHPVLEQIKSELYKQGAFYASMSGSGSSMYGLFKEEIEPANLPQFANYFVWCGKPM